MYKWNQMVKHETYKRQLPDVFGEYHTFHRVTIAAGTIGEGLMIEEAQRNAEREFSDNEQNQFVIRHGTPRHVKLTELTANEVRERVPGIVL